GRPSGTRTTPFLMVGTRAVGSLTKLILAFFPFLIEYVILCVGRAHLARPGEFAAARSGARPTRGTQKNALVREVERDGAGTVALARQARGVARWADCAWEGPAARAGQVGWAAGRADCAGPAACAGCSGREVPNGERLDRRNVDLALEHVHLLALVRSLRDL